MMKLIRAGKPARLYRLVLPVVLAGLLLSACNSSNQASVLSTTQASDTADSAQEGKIPWDYRIVQGDVGDLVGGDMVILPDNALLPNDGNYATGDKVWTLQYMTAEMTTTETGSDQIQLSAWQAIKSYPDEAKAKADLANVKVDLQTTVQLVGVYKTSYQGKSRQFAVITLPSGNQLKQPIDEQRYAKMKSLKQVLIKLEEIHDYADYDLAYAKFRGWAE
ncbi:signal peptide protein [Paenibacillus rhizovicinus]|uniref:Signal peptide protein n=1 Tax=Paenibacillus rhizovicinus TaxID=2704463 RepID=A0A6C0NXV3_9BACL|nr:hypothetical protein [Paenibacillus rhizovicinus]QHW31060.1 signal peptide protein [Paenibacillus rhizovicinus]